MKLATLRCVNKRQFYSKQECLESIARQRPAIPLFAYLCPECNRWHKTKHDPNRYPGRGPNGDPQ